MGLKMKKMRASLRWTFPAACLLFLLLPVTGSADDGEEKPPLFVLKDGGRISGEFQATELKIETAYGTLTVPITDVQKVILGKISDPDLARRIETLIRTLGDSSFDAREKAMEGLRELGRAVEPELRRAAESEDPEIKQRAKAILGEFEEEDAPADEDEVIPEEDALVTARFTIRGKLLLESFEVKTRFGPLKFEKKDVRILYVHPPEFIRREVKVPGTSTVNRGMFDTELRVERGSRLTMRASGSIVIQNWGGSTGPEGGPNWGRYNNQFQSGALLGRIGTTGQLFLVGRHFTGEIDRGGNLFLGIALNDGGQNTGEFRVRIEVRPKD